MDRRHFIELLSAGTGALITGCASLSPASTSTTNDRLFGPSFVEGSAFYSSLFDSGKSIDNKVMSNLVSLSGDANVIEVLLTQVYDRLSSFMYDEVKSFLSYMGLDSAPSVRIVPLRRTHTRYGPVTSTLPIYLLWSRIINDGRKKFISYDNELIASYNFTSQFGGVAKENVNLAFCCVRAGFDSFYNTIMQFQLHHSLMPVRLAFISKQYDNLRQSAGFERSVPMKSLREVLSLTHQFEEGIGAALIYSFIALRHEGLLSKDFNAAIRMLSPLSQKIALSTKEMLAGSTPGYVLGCYASLAADTCTAPCS